MTTYRNQLPTERILIRECAEAALIDPTPTYTCRCGHRAHWHLFHQDGLGNELPYNHHRCPACGWQWARIKNPDRRSRISHPVVLKDVAQPVL